MVPKQLASLPGDGSPGGGQKKSIMLPTLEQAEQIPAEEEELIPGPPWQKMCPFDPCPHLEGRGKQK